MNIMNELMAEVQASVFMEYERAAKKFGKANNSPHESYAVILEEFEEAKLCHETFRLHFANYWNFVKKNSEEAGHELSVMRKFAEQAAAEWIQVAAMCYKATKKDGE
jgi:hypothetical protein